MLKTFALVLVCYSLLTLSTLALVYSVHCTQCCIAHSVHAGYDFAYTINGFAPNIQLLAIRSHETVLFTIDLSVLCMCGSVQRARTSPLVSIFHTKLLKYVGQSGRGKFVSLNKFQILITVTKPDHNASANIK